MAAKPKKPDIVCGSYFSVRISSTLNPVDNDAPGVLHHLCDIIVHDEDCNDQTVGGISITTLNLDAAPDIVDQADSENQDIYEVAGLFYSYDHDVGSHFPAEAADRLGIETMFGDNPPGLLYVNSAWIDSDFADDLILEASVIRAASVLAPQTGDEPPIFCWHDKRSFFSAPPLSGSFPDDSLSYIPAYCVEIPSPKLLASSSKAKVVHKTGPDANRCFASVGVPTPTIGVEPDDDADRIRFERRQNAIAVEIDRSMIADLPSIAADSAALAASGNPAALAAAKEAVESLLAAIQASELSSATPKAQNSTTKLKTSSVG